MTGLVVTITAPTALVIVAAIVIASTWELIQTVVTTTSLPAIIPATVVSSLAIPVQLTASFAVMGSRPFAIPAMVAVTAVLKADIPLQAFPTTRPISSQCGSCVTAG